MAMWAQSRTAQPPPVRPMPAWAQSRTAPPPPVRPMAAWADLLCDGRTVEKLNPNGNTPRPASTISSYGTGVDSGQNGRKLPAQICFISTALGRLQGSEGPKLPSKCFFHRWQLWGDEWYRLRGAFSHDLLQHWAKKAAKMF